MNTKRDLERLFGNSNPQVDVYILDKDETPFMDDPGHHVYTGRLSDIKDQLDFKRHNYSIQLVQGGGRRRARVQLTKAVAQMTRKGGASKRWRDNAPRRGTERRRMARDCGRHCFLGRLDGGDSSFPICRKKTCERNEKGVAAALYRARQMRGRRPRDRSYRSIERRAKSLLNKMERRR